MSTCCDAVTPQGEFKLRNSTAVSRKLVSCAVILIYSLFVVGVVGTWVIKKVEKRKKQKHKKQKKIKKNRS